MCRPSLFPCYGHGQQRVAGAKDATPGEVDSNNGTLAGAVPDLRRLQGMLRCTIPARVCDFCVLRLDSLHQIHPVGCSFLDSLPLPHEVVATFAAVSEGLWYKVFQRRMCRSIGNVNQRSLFTTRFLAYVKRLTKAPVCEKFGEASSVFLGLQVQGYVASWCVHQAFCGLCGNGRCIAVLCFDGTHSLLM